MRRDAECMQVVGYNVFNPNGANLPKPNPVFPFSKPLPPVL